MHLIPEVFLDETIEQCAAALYHQCLYAMTDQRMEYLFQGRLFLRKMMKLIMSLPVGIVFVAEDPCGLGAVKQMKVVRQYTFSVNYHPQGLWAICFSCRKHRIVQ